MLENHNSSVRHCVLLSSDFHVLENKISRPITIVAYGKTEGKVHGEEGSRELTVQV